MNLIACRRTLSGVILAIGAGLTWSTHATFASEPSFATAWVKDHSTAVRLIAGGHAPGQSGSVLYAGIEITLDEGWKTYWRNPGSSGVPPRVDWSASENLAEAVLMFPAPERFADKEGDTIGYKRTVVLPVSVRPKDAGKPINLKLALEYGVCREVCIPVQKDLTLLIPSLAEQRPAGTSLIAALAKVPKSASARGPADPVVRSVDISLTTLKPRIIIAADFPGTTKGGDIFLEAPEGLWIPLAKPLPAMGGTVRSFEVDLTDGADINDLKGRTIRLTLVSSAGQSETTFKFE